MVHSKPPPPATSHEIPDLTEAVRSLRDHVQLVGNILDELRTQFVWATRNGRIVVERDARDSAEGLTADVDEHPKRSVPDARSAHAGGAPAEPLSLAQPSADETHFTPTELLFPEALRQVPGLAQAIADIELQLGLTRRQAGMLLTALELLLQHAPDEIRTAIDRLAGAIGAQTRAIAPLEHAIGEFTTDFQWALRRMQEETGSIAGELSRDGPREEPCDADLDTVFCCPQPRLEWSGPHEHPSVSCANCGYVVAEEGQLISYADAENEGYMVTEEADAPTDSAACGTSDERDPGNGVESAADNPEDSEGTAATSTTGAAEATEAKPAENDTHADAELQPAIVSPATKDAAAATETSEAASPLTVHLVALESEIGYRHSQFALYRSDGYYWSGLVGWMPASAKTLKYCDRWEDDRKPRIVATTMLPKESGVFDPAAAPLLLPLGDERPHVQRLS